MQMYWSSLRYSFLRTLFLLADRLRHRPTPARPFPSFSVCVGVACPARGFCHSPRCFPCVFLLVDLQASWEYGCISMLRCWSSLRYSSLRTLFLLARRSSSSANTRSLRPAAGRLGLTSEPSSSRDVRRHALPQGQARQRIAWRSRTFYFAGWRRLPCAIDSKNCGAA